MSDTYLIPQFIIEYLEKCRSSKNPHKLVGIKSHKFKTAETEKWFKDNDVDATHIWKFFVSQGKTEFYCKTCAVCGKRIKIGTLVRHPNAKYCSRKCSGSSKEEREKRKQTFLEKYGVECPLQSKEVQEKSSQTRRSNHWETFCSLLREKDIIPLFSKEEYANDTGRKFKCLVCGEEFESEGTNNYNKYHTNKDGTYKTLQIGNIYCHQCAKSPYSKKEKEVLSFVKSIYSGIIEENAKGLFQNGNMELDIFLPSLNLGIEFDGTYWHSKEGAKEKDERKTRLCEQKGIRLLRIKESDWDTNPQAVKETLLEAIKRS